MTIPSTTRKAGPLLGTGAQTAWPFTFKVFAESDIAVTIADSLGLETALVLDTDYSVALNANQDTSPGGTVTYPISGTALATGSVLSIVGDLDYDQPLDLPSGGNFSPVALENELDRITMQVQQLRETISRSLLVPVTSDAAPALPFPEANQLIGWDATGSTLQNVPVSDLATAVAYGTFRYDTFTGDGVTTQYTLTSDPAAVGNLDVAMDGLTMVPGTDYSLASGVLVFTVAPSNGAEILARYGQAIPSVGGVDASAVTYQPTGAGAVASTVQEDLREQVKLTRFFPAGFDHATTDGSTYHAAALAVIAITKQKLIIPNGTYKGTFVISGAGYSNITIEGESVDGVVLVAKDNATSVISITTSAFYPTIKNVTISPGATGNNGTHYGIYNDSVSGMTLENIKISGFNNNIHIVENNNNRLSKIVSDGAVYAAGITGCGIYASGIGAAGPGFWLKDSSITTGKFGIYLDAIEAPTISDSECLLQTDTGLYVTNSVPAYSTGPFLTNFFADSSSQAAIYLQKQINSMFSNVWVSGSIGTSKGLVMSDSLKGSFNIQAFGNQGYAVHIAGASKFNTFTGVVSNNASDGIVIDNGCFGNTFNGVAIHANTGRGYNWSDVTVDEPNSLIGCYVAGNGVANVKQGKDIDVGGNYLTGQTSSFQYTRAAIAATQATTMGGITDQVVMPRAGALVGFSTYLTAATTAGALNVRPMVNGAVKDTLLVNMTAGSNAQYGSVALSGKSVRFAAGDRIAAYFDADAGFLPSGSANLSATCWVIFD